MAITRIFGSLAKLIDIGCKDFQGEVSIGSDGYTTGSSLQGATVSRSAPGEYTIVLQSPFKRFLFTSFTVSAATGVDLVPQVKSENPSTGTIVVRLNTGATTTAPAAPIKLKVFIRASSNTK